MTPEDLAKLRRPFDKNDIGKLPKITCGSCSKAQTRNCSEHRKEQCKVCGNWITTKHTHLDYVGHAACTNRLLEVDPAWTWEPAAFDDTGMPAVDKNGGMWIRLTVCGVTRLGYGHSDGKTGGNATKEVIGDAIRNAAMRFGVAIDLWHKGTLSGATEPTSETYDTATQPADDNQAAGDTPAPPARTVIRRAPAPEVDGNTITPQQVNKLSIMFNRAKFDDDAIDGFISNLTGGRTTSRKELTKAEASKAIDELSAVAA